MNLYTVSVSLKSGAKVGRQVMAVGGVRVRSFTWLGEVASGSPDDILTLPGLQDHWHVVGETNDEAEIERRAREGTSEEIDRIKIGLIDDEG